MRTSKSDLAQVIRLVESNDRAFGDFMFDFLFSGDQRGRQRMTRRQHYRRDLALGRAPFGRGVSPRRTVLLVPELRKRRGERDPEALREQMDRAAGLVRR